MNVLYAKCLLYAYSNLDGIAEQIDELVYKKALASISDFSPCEEQCYKIITLSYNKRIILKLKKILTEYFKKCDKDMLDYFDYKYFRIRPRSHYKNFDSTSRAYFRKQIKYCKVFAEKIEKYGITDAWFEENCLSTSFFKDMLARVKEHEVISRKNLSKAEKAAKINVASVAMSGCKKSRKGEVGLPFAVKNVM